MASERIRRHVENLLDEDDQAIANEDWATVASRVDSAFGPTWIVCLYETTLCDAG